MNTFESTSIAYYPGVTVSNTEQDRTARLHEANLPEKYWDIMGSYGFPPLAAKLGIRLKEVSVELISATMPIAGNEQNVGILHGGAHLVIAETLGSVATVLHADALNDSTISGVVGTEISASHSRGGIKGEVLAECRPIHLGKSLAIHEIVITDEQDRRLSTVRMTNMILRR